jgi:hypothetical protein
VADVHERPWSKCTDDPYEAYGNWEKWMDERMDKPCIYQNNENCMCGNCEIARWWDEAETSVKVAIYAAMCDAVDEAQKCAVTLS